MPAAAAHVRVLVVDDDEVDRRAVRRALGAGYNVAEASSGKQALELVEALPPDCVLLDYNIPGTDALMLLDALRLRVPVVMLTGQGDIAVAVAAMKRGAQDYLSKTSLSGERLELAIHRSIEKVERQREHLEARARLRSEYSQEKRRRRELEDSLNLARDIQQNLLPAAPPVVEGFEVYGVCLPMEATAGDFFDYFSMPDGSLGIVVGDVSGHGIGPAILTAETRASIRALAHTRNDVGEIATLTNRLLCEDMLPGRFVTLFLVRLDPAARMFTYAAAGHPGYLIRHSGEVAQLESEAPPLGMFPESIVPTGGPVAIDKGDFLLMATDGLFETRASDGTIFGADRCARVIRENREAPVEKVVDELLHAARQFSERAPMQDDTSVLVVRAR